MPLTDLISIQFSEMPTWSMEIFVFLNQATGNYTLPSSFCTTQENVNAFILFDSIKYRNETSIYTFEAGNSPFPSKLYYFELHCAEFSFLIYVLKEETFQCPHFKPQFTHGLCDGHKNPVWCVLPQLLCRNLKQPEHSETQRMDFSV